MIKNVLKEFVKCILTKGNKTTCIELMNEIKESALPFFALKFTPSTCMQTTLAC